MPESAEIGIFLHILGVFGLGGATAISLVVFSMARRAQTTQELRHWMGLGALLGKYYVFPAAGLFLLLTGGYLVDKVHEDWGTGWIGISALALIAAVAVGFFVNTPRMKAIGMAAGPAPDGPVPGNITALLNDPVLFAGIHGATMASIAILWNMTTRPGGLGALLAIVVLVGIGVGSAYPAYQRQQAQA